MWCTQCVSVPRDLVALDSSGLLFPSIAQSSSQCFVAPFGLRCRLKSCPGHDTYFQTKPHFLCLKRESSETRLLLINNRVRQIDQVYQVPEWGDRASGPEVRRGWPPEIRPESASKSSELESIGATAQGGFSTNSWHKCTHLSSADASSDLCARPVHIVSCKQKAVSSAEASPDLCAGPTYIVSCKAEGSCS